MTYNSIVGFLSFLLLLLGGFLGISAYLRKAKKDGEQAGALAGILDSIRQGIEDISLEQKEARKALNKLTERITSVEASDKAAHKRIDRLE